MSYEDFVPHPSTFITGCDSASEDASRWSWVLPALGVAAAIAAAVFLVWLLFFRGKAVAAQSAVKAAAEIANPFNWK